MPENISAPDKRRFIIFFITAAIVIAADQLTKAWIRANLDLGEVYFQLGIFRILRSTPNTGSAFGLFQGHMSVLSIVAIIFIVLLLAYIFYFCRRFPELNHFPVWLAISLIFSGAAGNLIDRLGSAGTGVTDFISVGWFPVFNVADSAITVGGVLLAVWLLFFSDFLRAEKK